jgi:hypothetical protein
MSAFDKEKFELKILSIFGKKDKVTCKYLCQKLHFYEMLHLIVFRGNFKNFEIINIDFEQEIDFNDGNVKTKLPYFEIVRCNNE